MKSNELFINIAAKVTYEYEKKVGRKMTKEEKQELFARYISYKASKKVVEKPLDSPFISVVNNRGKAPEVRTTSDEEIDSPFINIVNKHHDEVKIKRLEEKLYSKNITK